MKVIAATVPPYSICTAAIKKPKSLHPHKQQAQRDLRKPLTATSEAGTSWGNTKEGKILNLGLVSLLFEFHGS